MFESIFFLNRLAAMPIGNLVGLFIFSLVAFIVAIIIALIRDGNDRFAHLRKYWAIYTILFLVFPFRYFAGIFYKLFNSVNYIWIPILLILGVIMEVIEAYRQIDRGSYFFGSPIRRYGRGRSYEDYNNGAFDDMLYGDFNQQSLENRIYENEVRSERRTALKKAAPFLEPYYDIMGDLTLYNTRCILRFYYRGGVFRYLCNTKDNDSGRVIRFKAMSDKGSMWNNGFFNSVLKFFSEQTTADSLYGIFSDAKYFDLAADFNEIEPVNDNTLKAESDNEMLTSVNSNAIDVNSASEDELQKLPGINIVLAKRIVIQRETVGEFVSVEDFFKKMNIKNHFANKIKKLIKVEKMKKDISRNNGRMLDI